MCLEIPGGFSSCCSQRRLYGWECNISVICRFLSVWIGNSFHSLEGEGKKAKTCLLFCEEPGGWGIALSCKQSHTGEIALKSLKIKTGRTFSSSDTGQMLIVIKILLSDPFIRESSVRLVLDCFCNLDFVLTTILFSTALALWIWCLLGGIYAPVSYWRTDANVVTFGRSWFVPILWAEFLLGMLEMCVKCMGMLERLRIGVTNYGEGKNAQRIWGRCF